MHTPPTDDRITRYEAAFMVTALVILIAGVVGLS